MYLYVLVCIRMYCYILVFPATLCSKSSEGVNLFFSSSTKSRKKLPCKLLPVSYFLQSSAQAPADPPAACEGQCHQCDLVSPCFP